MCWADGDKGVLFLSTHWALLQGAVTGDWGSGTSHLYPEPLLDLKYTLFQSRQVQRGGDGRLSGPWWRPTFLWLQGSLRLPNAELAWQAELGVLVGKLRVVPAG